MATTDLELERIAALGWRAAETAPLGDWLLRASGGFTGRANSALAIGEPGRPIEAAISAVEDWYSSRGLPPRFMLPLPHAAELDAELGQAGWEAFDEVRVLVIDIDRLTAAATGPALSTGGGTPDRVVRIDPRPDRAWLDGYHYRGAELPSQAVDVIVRGDVLGFASVRDEQGRVLAISRGSVDRGWLGITAVEVDSAHRRQGLAGAVMTALAEWAALNGASHCYLQVAVENDAALALYGAAGFEDHHRYRYRIMRRQSRDTDMPN